MRDDFNFDFVWWHIHILAVFAKTINCSCLSEMNSLIRIKVKLKNMRMAGEVQGSQDRGILEVLNVELKTYEMELPRLLGRCAGMVGPHPQYVVIKGDRAIGPIDTEND